MAGVKVLPDQVTFNTMINGYAQCGRVDDAERVLELMKKKDIEPSTITLNTMMVAYINGGRADAVEQVEQVFGADAHTNIHKSPPIP